MTRIVYLYEAARDVEDAVEWYESQTSGLGREFLDALRVAEGDIGAAPRAYRVAHRETHRYLLRRFPYQVLYRLEKETIAIVGVIHVRRATRVSRHR